MNRDNVTSFWISLNSSYCTKIKMQLRTEFFKITKKADNFYYKDHVKNRTISPKLIWRHTKWRHLHQACKVALFFNRKNEITRTAGSFLGALFPLLYQETDRKFESNSECDTTLRIRSFRLVFTAVYWCSETASPIHSVMHCQVIWDFCLAYEGEIGEVE